LRSGADKTHLPSSTTSGNHRTSEQCERVAVGAGDGRCDCVKKRTFEDQLIQFPNGCEVTYDRSLDILAIADPPLNENGMARLANLFTHFREAPDNKAHKHLRSTAASSWRTGMQAGSVSS